MKDLDYSQVVIRYPDYPHVIAVQKQRSFKDILLVSDIYDHCKTGRSLFHHFFLKERAYSYCREIKHVYANCWLDERYFPSYERITDIEQVETIHDGILFLHDLERLFNSRGSLTDKQMNRLIDIVNNMGKQRIMLRGSCHRNMSVDVKIRSLITLWIETTPYHVGDPNVLNNYFVLVDVYNANLIKIGSFVKPHIYAYANLYDTLERSKPLASSFNDKSLAYAKSIYRRAYAGCAKGASYSPKGSVCGGRL